MVNTESAASERQFMQLAIDAARKCQGNETNPRVGAVAASDGVLLASAFRGEVESGEHAEYTLLERHLSERSLTGATVYTTLEPCTKRNPPKICCARRLIQRKVGRVVVGMWDPNPLVSGFGCQMLREANICVEVFPPDLMSQVEELNREFVSSIQKDAVLQAAREIAELSTRSGTSRQREAVGDTIRSCVDSLRSIGEGEIPIPGREAGYFKRFLQAIQQSHEPEHIRAYIRLTAFDTEELYAAAWFHRFYEELEALISSGHASIEYVFLVRQLPLADDAAEFLSMFKRFADRISVIDENESRVSARILRPSVVLLTRQKIGFTHDRMDDAILLDATEWVSPQRYAELEERYRQLEIMSQPFFKTQDSRSTQIRTTTGH